MKDSSDSSTTRFTKFLKEDDRTWYDEVHSYLNAIIREQVLEILSTYIQTAAKNAVEATEKSFGEKSGRFSNVLRDSTHFKEETVILNQNPSNGSGHSGHDEDDENDENDKNDKNDKNEDDNIMGSRL